ncbi:MAG: DNA adenine methylase, partial [Planctomycetes bacterium]|nr:DNA adenine methylase [Planctomycetota bacterium]
MKQKREPAASEEARLHRTIWYMGAKARVIPGFLERVLEEEIEDGATVVDLMAGTGVVSAFCAGRYRVLANDVQLYSSIITSSLIEHSPRTKEAFLRSLRPDRDLEAAYRRNLAALERRYRPALGEEARWLDPVRRQNGGSLRRASLASWADGYRQFLLEPGGTYGDDLARGGSLYRGARSLLAERSFRSRRGEASAFPACLVTAYYANIYFGLRQAIEIDSLRAAIEALDPRDPFRERKRVHYLSALLHAASVSTSGTSHFAQPRHLDKVSELAAMARRRSTDIRGVFEEYHREIVSTLRRIRHRAGNRVFQKDYRAFIRDGRGFEFPRRPADLIYMDPPYTADNYSRFYHVLEVLARYDYPELQRDGDDRVTRGRYPLIDERFQSGFCRPGEVEDEFRRVITAAAAAGAKLVISYSSPTGLLLKRYARESRGQDPVKRFEALCREGYRRVRTLRRPMMHSGQGDSFL